MNAALDRDEHDEEVGPDAGVVFGADPQMDEGAVPQQDGRADRGDEDAGDRQQLAPEQRGLLEVSARR